MRYQALLASASKLLSRNLSVLVYGPPGIGKTALGRDIASTLNMNLITSHPSIADPVDFKGLPSFSNTTNGSGQLQPRADFIPFGQLRDLIEADSPTLWLIDDLIQAPPSVQAAIMQLVHPQGRELDGKKLSKHVRILACSNRRQDRAGGQGFIEPLKQRFVSLYLEASAEDWITWALGAGNIHPMVTSYIQWRPSHLLIESPSPDFTGSPNPRAWWQVSEVLDAGLEFSEIREILISLLGNTVGVEFTGFLRVADKLPDLDRIGTFPMDAEVPSDPAVSFALCAALTSMDEAPPTNLLRYVSRLRREYQVLFAKLAGGRGSKISSSKAFARWMTDNQSILAIG